MVLELSSGNKENQRTVITFELLGVSAVQGLKNVS